MPLVPMLELTGQSLTMQNIGMIFSLAGWFLEKLSASEIAIAQKQFSHLHAAGKLRL
jgi:hypothetical protein